MLTEENTPVETIVAAPKKILNYRANEDSIVDFFRQGEVFNFENESYVSLGSFKPSLFGGGGEPKTDIFVRAQNVNTNEIRNITISYKMGNADFIQNKMSKEQAETILGENYLDIIQHAATELKIGSRVFRDIKKETFVLGYRVDIVNKPGSGYYKLVLPYDVLHRIYSGLGLPDLYVNCMVNGEIIPNSGVADYMLIGDKPFYNAQDVADALESMQAYLARKPFVYVAFKALNFQEKKYVENRVEWDGDRPLAFTVNWDIDTEGNLVSNGINLNNIYLNKGNHVGRAFKELYIQNINK